jgi:hypothetical protein
MTPTHWNWMLISLIMHGVIYWLGAHGWIRILVELGEIDQAADHLANYWISLPFQYIGGFMGSSLGRFWLSKPLTVKNKTLVVALFIEKSLVVGCNVSALVTLTVFALIWRHHPEVFLPITGLCILSTLASVGLVQFSTYSRYPSTLNRAGIVALYLCGLPACSILALFALSKAISLPTPFELIFVARAYLASYFISQVAFIIPLGLGIREAVFTFLMHASAGILWPIRYALYARLLSIGGQLIPNLLFRLQSRVDGIFRPASHA